MTKCRATQNYAHAIVSHQFNQNWPNWFWVSVDFWANDTDVIRRFVVNVNKNHMKYFFFFVLFYVCRILNIELNLPANQHVFAPNRGRRNASCGLSGKLSKIAAMPVMSNGRPHAYTLYTRNRTFSWPFSIDVGRKSLQMKRRPLLIKIYDRSIHLNIIEHLK